MKITFLIIFCFSENVKFRYPVRAIRFKSKGWWPLSRPHITAVTVRVRAHFKFINFHARNFIRYPLGKQRNPLINIQSWTGYRNLTFSLKQKMIRNVIFTGSDRTSYYRPGPAINGPGQSRPVRTNPVAIPYRDEATSGGRGGIFLL